MARRASPTIRRRRLATELRRLREAANLTCEDVAARLECSVSKISRIETGSVRVSPRDARDLLTIYGVPADQQANFIQQARDSRQKDWWQAFSGQGLAPHVATYLDHEQGASVMRIYQAGRVHGLLQTEDYARAALSARRPGRTPADAERSVALLLERQRQASVSPPALRVVLGETALRYDPGGPAVQRGQLQHLLTLSEQSHIYLQVLPIAAAARLAAEVSFTVMSFPGSDDPDVTLVRYPTGLLRIEDTVETGQYNELFRRLQSAALSPADTTALIAALLTKQ